MDLLRKLRFVIILGTLALGTLGLICDGGIMTFANETSEEITVLYGKDPNAAIILTLTAGEMTKAVVYESLWQGSLVARDSSGEIIFEVELSWEELNELEQIVIK